MEGLVIPYEITHEWITNDLMEKLKSFRENWEFQEDKVSFYVFSYLFCFYSRINQDVYLTNFQIWFARVENHSYYLYLNFRDTLYRIQRHGKNQSWICYNVCNKRYIRYVFQTRKWTIKKKKKRTNFSLPRICELYTKINYNLFRSKWYSGTSSKRARREKRVQPSSDTVEQQSRGDVFFRGGRGR